MRARIIGVFAIVVLLVVVVSFALLRASLGDLSNKNESPRALTAAVAQLEVDALRVERWLAQQTAGEADLAAPLELPTKEGRGDAATKACDILNEAARSALPAPPERIVLVDAKGIVLGRSGSKLLRGDNLGERRPEMLETLKRGGTASDVWVDPSRGEQLLASYAPVHDKAGTIVGGVVVGMQLSDERLGAMNQGTSGTALFAATPGSDHLDVVAKSVGFKLSDRELHDLLAGLATPAAADSAKQALANGQVVDLAGVPSGYLASVRRLSGYGDDRRAVVVAVSPARIVGSLTTMILPLAGVLVLGLLLVVVGGYLLDAYISRPISEIEESLLAVINGQTETRLAVEHAVLGGLVFRINSLLNQLLGVTEDDTDAEGRPSYAPRPADFNAALNVDERMAAADLTDVTDATKLRDEPRDAYYRRIFEEYIEAKRNLGDPVDHITVSAFTARIAESEKQLSDKHGRPFRYRIQVQDKEVVLHAVPLA